jgi:DNA-binding NarL/FixJ family response regulator
MRVLLVGRPSIANVAQSVLVERLLSPAATRSVDPYASETTSAIRDFSPDLCVLLGSIWDSSGLCAFFGRLKEVASRARVVVFDDSASAARESAAMREGASAYICSACSVADLAKALRGSAGTARHLGGCVSHRILERAGAPSGVDTLSHRQREVLELIVAGARSATVAARLGISERTVEVHRRAIRKRLGAKNMADLVRIAVSWGIIEP